MQEIQKTIFLLFGIFSLVLTVGCIGFSSASYPEAIPDSDILFQIEHHDPYVLGVIQADATNYQALDIPNNFVRVSWSSSGKILYGLSNPEGMPPYGEIGYPAYWDIQNNSFKACFASLPHYKQIEEYENEKYPHAVILYVDEEVIIFDIDSCQTIQYLVDNSKSSGRQVISGFSFNTKRSELLYGQVNDSMVQRSMQLFKLNIQTGENIEVAEGINPAWSPDGTKIAYLGMNGIYILSMGKQDLIHLYNTKFFDLLIRSSTWAGTPQPRWSPDGKWIVFHQCITGYVCIEEEAAIYKIRVSDGKLEKIFTGGMFPIWNP